MYVCINEEIKQFRIYAEIVYGKSLKQFKKRKEKRAPNTYNFLSIQK